MAIIDVNGKFVISSHQVWMPGCYDTVQTTWWAFKFPDEILRELQDEANKRNGGYNGVITKSDLRSKVLEARDLKKKWKTSRRNQIGIDKNQ